MRSPPDHLGSSSYISNLDGEVVQHVEYVPFGEVFLEEKNAKWNTPYLFNAKELDRETGLYYYGARYYDPKGSIWTSVDPLAVYNPVMESQFYGDGQHNAGIYNNKNLNPYIYCYQNPVIYEDPNGKQNYSVILGGLGRLISNTAAAALGSAHATASAYSWGIGDLTGLTEPPKTFSRSQLISYYAGRAIADIAMIVEGGNIAGTGGTVALTTGAETFGVGAVAGAGVAVYGGGVAVTGSVDLSQSLASLMSLGVNPENTSNSSSSSSSSSQVPEYKKAKPGVSGKEGAKDVPDWAKGNKPFKNENGKQFAKRLLNEKYGEGNCKTGPKTEYNQIQKWGDRSFE